jgi:hypothetical protein
VDYTGGGPDLGGEIFNSNRQHLLSLLDSAPEFVVKHNAYMTKKIFTNGPKSISQANAVNPNVM